MGARSVPFATKVTSPEMRDTPLNFNVISSLAQGFHRLLEL